LATEPNYDSGPVWRVTYYHLKPGQGESFWKDFRQNLKPVYDAVKKEGMLTDYKVWINATTDGPEGWDIAAAIFELGGTRSDRCEGSNHFGEALRFAPGHDRGGKATQ
jgi:hypothetical protein